MTSPSSTTAARLIDAVTRPMVEEADDADGRLIRRTLTATYIAVSLLTPVWGAVYIAFGEVASGLIPICYAALTAVSFALLRRPGGWEVLRLSQLVQHLVLPFVLMWTLGGFGPSSAILIWALLAPLSSLWANRLREALYVIGGFILLTALTAVLNPVLDGTNDIPSWARTGFYAGNFIVMTTVVFSLVAYFGREHAAALDVMRRNRELESAYLEQEVSLRQSEKLATIGRLSAGLAHELNNPAAAVQQATRGLSDELVAEAHTEAAISRILPDEAQRQALQPFVDRIQQRAGHPDFTDPLERSDREDELAQLLQDKGLDDAWELAPALVGLGLQAEELERLEIAIGPDRFTAALEFLTSQFNRQNLIGSLEESTGRIVAMVRALKSYTHLDQAPSQLTDVHEGLDSTLVMLQNRLKTGVEVQRRYADDVPMIEAFPGELNQVWTNIIDNAVDAMGGEGVVVLTTELDGDEVVVRLADNGPGVPSEIADTIFDPFVTTKKAGEGTGLGLSISHGIVTQKHHGTLSMTSRPGETEFVVRLPIQFHSDAAGAANGG